MGIAELLQIRPGITAVTGSGGKTTLLGKLVEELRERSSVILTTTTHIWPPANLPLVTQWEPEAVRTALESAGTVCLGQMGENGKLGSLRERPEEFLALAPYVLIEADGSRGLPMKAHLPTEPVIPAGTGQVIAVFGASAFGRPLGEAAHRPLLAAEKLGCALEAIITPSLAARLLRLEGLPDRLVINQAEERMALAGEMAALLPEIPVFGGSVREGKLCLL